MGALMRGRDWSGTPFGSPVNWPQSLRSAVSIMLNSRYPIALYWGPELALLYNVMTTAEGVWQEDELLPMNRRGYLEECYYNFTFSPVRGESGTIDGIFNAVVETTD